MFENTLELAENKLLLLYILSEIKIAISNNQLTQIILENNYINYFILQQYIDELKNSDFIDFTEKEGKQRILITKKGLKVLELFKNRIPETKQKSIKDYLEKQIPKIKKEVTVTADYTIEKNNNYIVNLKVEENDTLLFDIKVNMPTKKHAVALCKKWKSNSSQMYLDILKYLTGD